MCELVFFFNDTATTEIYTLSLHDALPISDCSGTRRDRVLAAPGYELPVRPGRQPAQRPGRAPQPGEPGPAGLHPGDQHCRRSEEHTSELQSRQYLVCRLLLEKKKYIL